MLNYLTYQIKLDAETLLFVTLHERSTDEPLLAKISGAPSIVTVGTNMFEKRIGAIL